MNISETFSNKTILITGGLGLIGSNLAHALVAIGAKVTIFDALLPLYGGNIFNVSGIKDRIEIIKKDIRDKEAVQEAVKGKDYIFNLAAQVSYYDSQIEPFIDLDINCNGHLIVLESCRQFNKDAVIMFSGSRMQYGKINYNPVDEAHPTEPLSIYGIHKLTGEKYYLMYNRIHGLKTIVFRIANPYGPRHQMKHSKYGIVNWFLKMAMENQVITVFGDGSQMRDYVYVKDIVDAFLCVTANEKAQGQVFNLGSGEGSKFIDMANLVVSTVGNGRIDQVPWPKDYFNIETGDYIADISKMQKITGWKPSIGIKEGIQETFQYYLKYKNHYWN